MSKSYKLYNLPRSRREALATGGFLVQGQHHATTQAALGTVWRAITREVPFQSRKSSTISTHGSSNGGRV